MDYHRITILFHTLKFLKGKQVYYRLFYFVRNRFFPNKAYKHLTKEVNDPVWNGKEIYFQNAFREAQKFVFLNLQHDFTNKIDWNYSGFGKLWTYNLNYFDFLNQKSITTKKGLDLIKDYMEAEKKLQDGLEPYPISLRGINWIKFLSRNQIKDHAINEVLYNHYQRLYHNLEYHLLGNHLLENGYSLFFGAYYFQDEKIYQKAKAILEAELVEQVLEDGAHFERSPMYHQILLHRLLDCINLAQRNPWKEDGLLSFLKGRAGKMLSWLDNITYDNGEIPMVNDAAYGIAPNAKEIKEYATFIGLKWFTSSLGASGYRKFHKNGFEVVMDVGNVGPDYQPGHAHSDTFSFELYLNQRPIVVDTGTSTYEKNELRQLERETAAHNTVKVGNREQSEVWGGFRVGKRAKITALHESPNVVSASHNGYRPYMHRRKFDFTGETLLISDVVENYNGDSTAFLHFHPDTIEDIEQDGNIVRLNDFGIEFEFQAIDVNVQSMPCHIAMGFNNRKSSIKLSIGFKGSLKTAIRSIKK